MWRNISWNSTDSTLPEGMHRHETGPYFKTPSIQSASSSQSGAAGTTAATVAVAPPITMSVIVAGQAPPAPELHTSAQLAAEESEQATKQSSFECMGATSQTGSSRQAPQAVSSMLELVSAHSPGRRDSSCETDTLSQQAPSSQQQQASKAAAAATPTQPPQQQQRRTRFKDTPRQMSSSAGATPSTSNSTSQRNSGQCHQQPNPAGASHHQGFRSRLSSISGALQHPKLTRRFFSGHGGDSSDQHHEGSNHHLPHQASTVQITTTSIESPQHGSARDTAFGACVMGESEARPLTSSSGRRLSQLFLPHMGQNCILNQMQDPYASNELIPPHLLGLYGQPPLVGASGQPSQGGHRASWADTSLFGRLSNVRHSIDSGYQGAGQMRHSFDARSEQCNEQDNEDRPNCVQIMKKLFFSLVLGTLIAICWVMIIHTLKWIAIRGNEFEELQQLQAASLQPQLPSSSNYNQLTGNIHQANLLLAHQTVQERQAAGVAASSPRDPASAQSEGTNVSAASTPTSSTLGPQLFSVDADQSRRRRRRRRGGERARQQGEAHAEAMSAPDEIKPTTTQTNKIRPKRRPASRHEQPGGATENDNDDDWSLSGASFVPAAGAGAHSQGAAGQALLATSNIDEDSRPRRVMSLGERRRHNSNLADRQQQQQTRARAQQTHKQQQQQQEPRGDLGELAAGDENDELDSSASRNDLTSTIMSTGALGLEAQQSINDGNNSPQQSQQTNGNEADLSDSSMVPPATHLADGSSAIERSSPMDATAATTQALIYKAPFFTSWFVSIWNIAFMPVFTIISSCCFRNEESTTKKLLAESISQFMDNGLTTLQFLGRCAFFSVLWIGTIFGIVYSLAYLEATLVMALFACSPALVYLLSWVLLHQQFVGVRIVAVIICTTGIALLAYMDNSRTLGSVLIVAGSALCSAVYKVIYQRMFGFWSIAQMSLFFTLIGLFNAFLMWPIALLLYFLGVELIAWRHIPWFHLIAAGALHLTANVVAYFGPICSYDIFLTLGLLFAVVLSAVIDVTFYKITFFGMKLAGVLLLMIGFLVCLLPENWNEYLYDLANERFIRWKKQRSLKKSRNKVQDMSTGQMSRLRTPSGRVK